MKQTLGHWLTGSVKFNAVICGLIAAAFGLPPFKIPQYLLGGIIFGLVMGVGAELLLRRYEGRWLYKRRLFILIGIESLLLLYLFLPMYLAYFSVHPFARNIPAMPENLDAEVVDLVTSDGVTLKAWYLPSENGAAIIALHGSGGNRLSVLPHAEMLSKHGYGVLMIDMRAHGESGGTFVNGWNVVPDFDAAVAYLETRPDVEPNQIGALGLSSGAVSIFYGGESQESIQAFVADGVAQGTVDDLLNPLLPHPLVAPLLVPDYWIAEQFLAWFGDVERGKPLRDVVKEISPRPILFLAGEDSMWELELAERYQKSAGESATVWLAPDTGHVAAIGTHPEEYEAQVIAFFNAALLGE